MNKKRFLPTVLVTGFLGSGKTSFINWLLNNHPDRKISVILNEFGDIKLESQFIKKQDADVVELSNGCMCCVAKYEVPRIIHYIVENSPQSQYLFIEASGLSDPEPVTAMLKGLEETTGDIKYDANICIIDAENFEKMRKDNPLVLSQAGDSDIIIITKAEAAGKENALKLKKYLKELFIKATVLVKDDKLAPELFLDPQTHFEIDQSVKKQISEKPHHHHEDVKYFWYKSEKPVNLDKCAEIIGNLPEGIIRAKGIINAQLKEDEKAKILLQYVGVRMEFLKSQWDGEKPKTALLFIGRDFDENDLEQKLKFCEIVNI